MRASRSDTSDRSALRVPAEVVVTVGYGGCGLWPYPPYANRRGMRRADKGEARIRRNPTLPTHLKRTGQVMQIRRGATQSIRAAV